VIFAFDNVLKVQALSIGLVIAEAVSCPAFSAHFRFKFQNSAWGICDGQREKDRFFHASIIPSVLYTHIPSYTDTTVQS
jgi:hypothetical protein